LSVLANLKAATGIDEFAAMLGYKPSALAYILFKIPSSAKYTNFKIPKKSGGTREICAPIEPLKSLQRRLANVLYACCDEIDKESGLRSLSHGFRKGHSIVTNARPHHRRRYVLNLDLKDFFPTFNFGRVRGFFIKNKAFELNKKVATLIAQIACHENALPQGSPCSPIIADLLAHLLDVRLAQLAKKERVTYSRYADDLTFSTNQKQFPAALAARADEDGAEWVLGDPLVSRIENAGFAINPAKTRMQCRTSRQLVTGLTVNVKVNIRPEYYLKARAMCNSLFQTGAYWREAPPAAPEPTTEPDAANGEATEANETKPSANGSPSAKIPTNSLGPIGGILSHIHHVKDQIDQRDEIAKRTDKTAFRKLYMKFLFYKYFAALKKPLIVCEGKTDNVYLSLAIRHSPAFHPKLGAATAEGFERAVSLFSQLNQSHKILELDGGSGNFKFFILRYKSQMAALGHRPQAHPVIILIDNDDGAGPIFSVIKDNYGKTINLASPDAFFHITDNLYLIKTPQLPGKAKTCIEDFFESSLLNTPLGGKTFNPNKEKESPTEFGKHIFAEKVVRPKAATLKWDGFAPLLQGVCDVIDHYAALPKG
jgi:hypothetical protein